MSVRTLKCREQQQHSNLLDQRLTLYAEGSGSEDEPITYFAGNVVGLQPRAVAGFIQHYLEQWGTQALFAGLVQPPDSALLPWAQIELEVARQMGKIVGAKLEETFPMAGLEASLRLLIESFYRPVGGKTKIIVEKEALSSNFVSKTTSEVRAMR